MLVDMDRSQVCVGVKSKRKMYLKRNGSLADKCDASVISETSRVFSGKAEKEAKGIASLLEYSQDGAKRWLRAN